MSFNIHQSKENDNRAHTDMNIDVATLPTHPAKVAKASPSTPTFVYKRHAALALVKNLEQLHRNILTEIGRFGLSDYLFGTVNTTQGINTSLTTFPTELIKTYQQADFYRDDQIVGYLLANSRPTFRTVIEKYIDSAPIETQLIQRNRELISMWRNFGFLESYMIPADEDTSTLVVSAKNEEAEVVQSKIEPYADELCALAKVIRHVCLRKFPEILHPKESDTGAPISINKRPLEVIAALANGCPTVYAVAAELGISVNTANHHISTAKEALRATSLPHAVAIAVRQGLV